MNPSEQNNLIRNANRITGHGGVKKTLEKLKEDYYWKSLSFDVAKYIKNCILC